MQYEISQDFYTGPLDKLLELVEEKELEITSVTIASVTDEFLGYLAKLESEQQIDPHVIADFLVVASRLVLIKSKVLLPSLELSEEDEEDIRTFEERLRLYRDLKGTQAHIREMWSSFPRMMTREFRMGTESFFFPPPDVRPNALADVISRITGELKKILKPVEVVKSEIINLKQKIKEVLGRLTENPFSFSNLQKGRGKGEVVVLFLAVLHLLKEQLVRVEQSGHFGDITLAKRPPDAYNERE